MPSWWLGMGICPKISTILTKSEIVTTLLHKYQIAQGMSILMEILKMAFLEHLRWLAYCHRCNKSKPCLFEGQRVARIKWALDQIVNDRVGQSLLGIFTILFRFIKRGPMHKRGHKDMFIAHQYQPASSIDPKQGVRTKGNVFGGHWPPYTCKDGSLFNGIL